MDKPCNIFKNNPALAKRFSEGIALPEETGKYLLENYSAPQLAMWLAEKLIEAQASQPMLITMDEFMSHFRVKGTKWVDGKMVPEGRGSLRWKK